jgi:predicted transcriptional regulator of viral defense system
VAAQGANFLLRHVAPTRLFGLETLWRGHTKVTISDAARTLIDLIAMPETGGGIDHVAECLGTFLRGQNADSNLLIHYADQYGNGAIFKRLGFLAETGIHHAELTAACRFHRTLGYTRLDPSLHCPNLVTSWNLWVPAGWKANP